jgi:hypothetical protein
MSYARSPTTTPGRASSTAARPTSALRTLSAKMGARSCPDWRDSTWASCAPESTTARSSRTHPPTGQNAPYELDSGVQHLHPGGADPPKGVGALRQRLPILLSTRSGQASARAPQPPDAQQLAKATRSLLARTARLHAGPFDFWQVSHAQHEAAGVRFELTEPCGSAVFKTAPFDRSGTPPRTGIQAVNVAASAQPGGGT